MYLTALTTAYDPHTSYMSADTLENFEIQMRLNLEGIGAALEAPDGETVVKKIIPGGAASKDGRLKIEDRIIGVGQEADGPIVDVSDMKLNDVVRTDPRPRGHDGPPGSASQGRKGPQDLYDRAPANRADRQEARSEILEAGKKPNGSPYKVGVINLPSFYMDMSGARSGREDFKSTTRDVAKLLAQFQAENVDAVVIDLRHNGGGSLTESINLTGLFIDSGPVVQVKDFDGQKTQYDDHRTGRGLGRSAGRADQQVQRQRQRDLRRCDPGLQSRLDRRRHRHARQGHGAEPARPEPAAVPRHRQRPAARRAEDHDAAVLSSRRRQHAESRRAGRRRVALDHQPSGRGRGEPRLRDEVRQGRRGRAPALQPGRTAMSSTSCASVRPNAARTRRTSRRSPATSNASKSKRRASRSRSIARSSSPTRAR